MKASLEFHLPEEAEEFELASNGSRCANACDEFDAWLRNRIKYDELDEKEYEIYVKIRAKFWELRYE